MARRTQQGYDAPPVPEESPTAREQQLAAESGAAAASDVDRRNAAAKARAAAHQDSTHPQAGYLAALEAERRGYVTRGRTDRVEQVDAEIARVRRG